MFVYHLVRELWARAVLNQSRSLLEILWSLKDHSFRHNKVDKSGCYGQIGNHLVDGIWSNLKWRRSLCLDDQ